MLVSGQYDKDRHVGFTGWIDEIYQTRYDRGMSSEELSKRDNLIRNIEWTLLLILVSALLGAALFVWKRGGDRAGCIMNIRNVQQAVRGHHGMRNLNFDDPLPFSDIVGPGAYLEKMPQCPSGGTYRFLGRIPNVGELALECSLCDAPFKHKPDDYTNW